MQTFIRKRVNIHFFPDLVIRLLWNEIVILHLTCSPAMQSHVCHWHYFRRTWLLDRICFGRIGLDRLFNKICFRQICFDRIYFVEQLKKQDLGWNKKGLLRHSQVLHFNQMLIFCWLLLKRFFFIWTCWSFLYISTMFTSLHVISIKQKVIVERIILRK